MSKARTPATSLDERIENFMATKAVQFPKLGLAVIDPKFAESTLKPFHESLTDRLIEKYSKNIFSYLGSLVKSYPATTAYGRTHLVK